MGGSKSSSPNRARSGATGSRGAVKNRSLSGVTVTPSGGEVLFTDSSLPSYIDPLLMPPSVDKLRAGKPYRIYRFKLPAPAASLH